MAHHVSTFCTSHRCCTVLYLQDCDVSSIYEWQLSNASAAWEAQHGWPEDPVWTESNWPTGQPYLEIYQVSNALLEAVVLLQLVVTQLAARRTTSHGMQNPACSFRLYRYTASPSGIQHSWIRLIFLYTFIANNVRLRQRKCT